MHTLLLLTAASYIPATFEHFGQGLMIDGTGKLVTALLFAVVGVAWMFRRRVASLVGLGLVGVASTLIFAIGTVGLVAASIPVGWVKLPLAARWASVVGFGMLGLGAFGWVAGAVRSSTIVGRESTVVGAMGIATIGALTGSEALLIIIDGDKLCGIVAGISAVGLLLAAGAIAIIGLIADPTLTLDEDPGDDVVPSLA